jgi:hypothetical protein
MREALFIRARGAGLCVGSGDAMGETWFHQSFRSAYRTFAYSVKRIIMQLPLMLAVVRGNFYVEDGHTYPLNRCFADSLNMWNRRAQ